jgi:carbonic anhydrase
MYYKKLVVATLTVLGLQASAYLPYNQAYAAGPKWDYSGDIGPEHWGDLSPDYALCKNGKHQSPVDVTNPVKADLPALKFDYKSISLAIQNKAFTMNVTAEGAGTLTVGDQSYKLSHFHSHVPSDEAVNGKRTDMAIHLSHKSDKGGSLGVTVFLVVGAGSGNPVIETLAKALPKTPGEPQKPEGVKIDLNQLLPKDLNYFSYDGSLTWPPCTEGVKWILLKAPMTISAEQLAKFRDMFPATARPLQPLGDRKVLSSN